MFRLPSSVVFICVIAALGGCASDSSSRYSVKSARLAATAPEAIDTGSALDFREEERKTTKQNSEIRPLGIARGRAPSYTNIAATFSDTKQVQFSAEALSVKDFVQLTFAKLLDVNYVVSKEVADMEQLVTLNISEPVSARRAFELATEVLRENGISVAVKNNVFYLAKSEGNKDSIIGIGSDVSDVPNSTGSITQIIPIRYGSATLEGAVSQFVPVRASMDNQLNSLFVTGAYPDVIRALELVKMMDVPSNRGRYVRLVRLTYLTPEEFSKKVVSLLEGDGIDNIAIGTARGKNTLLVPLEHIGAVAVFSSEQAYVDRIMYWAGQIDTPGDGVQRRYFIYHPAYARAADLGESVAALLGQSTLTPDKSRDTASAFGTNNKDSSNTAATASSVSGRESGAVSVQGDKLSMTVDTRSNTLIFFAQGSEYQSILPMIRRLDVMPKQILLEATIAEVTLTDDFALGVEFAVRSGKLGVSTTGALGVSNMGGLNLGFIDGTDNVLAKLEQGNQSVNVLSNPYLVVRDGVTASISVGTDIPTVSSTTSDPILSDKQTTNITYRQTGLEFSILPTINGQGLVVMQIQQNISNQADGSVVSGAPAIFKRMLKTEVIANSGQTVLLGGLISENEDSGNKSVPGMSSLPLIGNLFKSRTSKKVKTELVLLITPRVIDAQQHWDYITGQLKDSFKHLQIEN